MQQGIHPDYRAVVFRDRSTGKLFLTRSTRASDRTVDIEGVSFPVVDCDVTSDSHPFWTGTAKVMDTEGRVEAFERRYGRKA